MIDLTIVNFYGIGRIVANDDFNASLVISTSDAVRNVRELDTTAKDLDKTLAHLHTTMQNTQGSMDKVAATLKDFRTTQRQVAADQKINNDNLIKQAKLEREGIVNKGKLNDETRKQAQHEAKLSGIRARGGRDSVSALGNELRKNEESATRQANGTALTTARVATENERRTASEIRTATALVQRAGAEDRAALSALRLANAQERSRNASLALNDSLSNSRYLLYDVGQTYAVLSAALLAVPVATTAVATAYEKDFAQVARTNMGMTDQQLPALRNELKALGREIPLSFGEFSKIASIAGQIGIAENEIGQFTETVAKFGAASNVTIEEASTAFGRLNNAFNADGKIEGFYNKVGSAIAKVGVESAASETEIIAVTNQISAAGSQSGFTAEQIVGLSGALASVRIRPELARGAFQRIMLQLSRSADQGAESFNTFGKYTGLAADESLALFKSDPSAFFHKYIGGIKATVANGASLSSVLDDVGAKNVFDKQFILGLANGYDVYTKSLSDAKGAFNEGTFLDESTKGVFETLAATLTKIATSFSNLADTLGKGSLAPLVMMGETILGVVNAFDRLITQQPAIGAVVNTLLMLGTVTGVFLAFKSAQAFVLAGLVGLQQVMGKASIAGALTLRGNVSELAKTMLMAKGASAQYATALLANKNAMQQLGIAANTTKAAIATGAAGSIGVLTAQTTNATSRMGAFGNGLKTVGTGLLGLVGGPIGALVGALGILGLSFITIQEEAAQAGDSIARALNESAGAGINAAAKALTDRKVQIGDGAVVFGNLNKNARELAKEIGLPFDVLVNAATKGKDAVKTLQPELDKLAQSKGFDNFDDWYNSMDPGVGKAVFLKNAVKDIGDAADKSGQDLDATANATEKLGGAAANAAPSVDGINTELEDTESAADKATQAIQKAVDAIFGLVNAEAATQDSLQRLGESLFDTSSFNPVDEGGRENLGNFQDVLRNAALQQQQLINSGQQTAEQAAANYGAFIDGLMQQLVAKGVDPAQVQAMADQAKGIFGTTFASGTQPTVTPTVDGSAAQAGAATTASGVQSTLDSADTTIGIDVSTDNAVYNLNSFQAFADAVTARQYEAGVEANTESAVDNTFNLYDYISGIVGLPYTARVNADTSAGIANLQNLANFAQSVLTAIQWGINSIGGSLSASKNASAEIGSVNTNKRMTSGPMPMASAPKVAAPAAPSQIPSVPTPNFPALNNGYDKAAKAAQKAGDAGKKAGEDMANGIDDATEAANDYASRLKTGLQSAFDKQYGMASATDAYYKALNDITKKREEELGQIDDLIEKQKELNNSRDEDLIKGRQAGTEKAISLKYGETDRAADYAQQEKEALDSAAAKQKDIDANNKTIISLKAGIDNFTGYSEAAIENREALRNLESKMLDMVAAYAATGATTEQVRAYAQKLTAQFQTDAGQVWKNRVEIINLTGDMGRYIGVINNVPYYKETKVGANTAGALGNIAGVQNALNSIPNYTEKRIQVRGGLVFDNNHTSDGQPIYRVIDSDGQYRGVKLFNKGGLVPGFAGGGLIPGKSPSNPNVDNLMADVDGKGMVKVRSGEFIVQQPAVDYWGLDFFKTLNNMKMPAFNAGGSIGGGRSSGQAGAGAVLVELTADNLRAIAQLANTPTNLFVGVEKLASTVNEGNKILASKGVKIG